jgi:hypothetical protein
VLRALNPHEFMSGNAELYSSLVTVASLYLLLQLLLTVGSIYATLKGK